MAISTFCSVDEAIPVARSIDEEPVPEITMFTLVVPMAMFNVPDVTIPRLTFLPAPLPVIDLTVNLAVTEPVDLAHGGIMPPILDMSIFEDHVEPTDTGDAE